MTPASIFISHILSCLMPYEKGGRHFSEDIQCTAMHMRGGSRQSMNCKLHLISRDDENNTLWRQMYYSVPSNS